MVLLWCQKDGAAWGPERSTQEGSYNHVHSSVVSWVHIHFPLSARLISVEQMYIEHLH